MSFENWMDLKKSLKLPGFFLFAGQDGTTWRGRVKDFVNEIWWNLVCMKLKAMSMHLTLYFILLSGLYGFLWNFFKFYLEFDVVVLDHGFFWDEMTFVLHETLYISCLDYFTTTMTWKILHIAYVMSKM